MENDDLLNKWLNDELDQNELIAFKQRDDYRSHVAILEAAQGFKASNFSEVVDFDTFKEKYKKQDTPVRRMNWTHSFIRIASVLVIAFGVYFTFFYNNFTQIETQVAEKITFELPDASLVTLNAGSQIDFKRRHWAKERRLNLSGEAYFKVAKGSRFDVNTKEGQVTVVGTEFNVKQRDNYFEVKCFEGIVKVASNNNEAQLKAGDTFTILNGKFDLGITTSSQPEWIDNRSIFSGIPFIKVVDELKRQYDLEIELIDVDTNRVFSGGFGHDNLDNALNAITQPMNLTFNKKSQNHVVIHGSKEQ
ncbi:MAG: FecR family protein [Flavobacteriaceae bacterium]|nr:FecR family protein [Flavobacteriaceae bacterium]NNL32507.1 FecR family protein [Flavobacteriaceae bacterium]